MKIFPDNAIAKIEFDKIKQITSEFCVSDIAKSEILSEEPYRDQLRSSESLDFVDELQALYHNNLDHPINYYYDVREICDKLEITNVVLEVQEVQAVLRNTMTVEALHKFFSEKENVELFPKHKNLIGELFLHKDLSKSIRKILSEEGEVKDSASPKLRVIRTEIKRKNSELNKVFQKVLRKYKKDGVLSDNPESIKFGRRVLSLPVENKRKVEGMIHAESSSGRTVFIEPKELSLLNNQLTDLSIEERNEIYKILKELSAEIAPHREEFRLNLSLLILMDMYQAKSKLAFKMEASKPKLSAKAEFKLKQAYHPFLLWKNNSAGQKTIAFDLYLNKDSRMLLLSGPNAGGKTISMKAVGLITCMLQSGYLVPVDSESQIGWFDQMFVELGDQQSIENELSTYSSRLLSMKHILQDADSNSLVLIDEFGSGTDPRIGGAIAEAMLEKLLELKSIAVITTHYDNLKKFAFRKQGIINGSMLFDMKNISPSYQLKIGKPGSSYGLEIAQRIGLPKKIVARAKELVGSKQIKVEDLLNSIEKENLATIDAKQKLESKGLQLDRLIKQYDQMFADFELKRKRLKLEIRQLEAQKIAAQKMSIDQYLKELKDENKKEEDLVKLSVEFKEKMNESKEDLKQVQEEYKSEIDKTNAQSKLEIGDHVKLKTADTQGQIIDFVKEGVALVEAGIFKLNVAVGDLVRINEPLEIKSRRSVDYNSGTQHFNPKIDIRGYKLKDAEAIIEEFYDKALLSNYRSLTILHGVGSGTLKKMVWRKAKEYNFSECSHPEEEYGGERLTNVRI